MFMNEKEQAGVINIVANMASSHLTDQPDDTPVADLFNLAVEGACEEWFCTPAQGLLGAAIAAVVGWLKKRGREEDAEHLMYEGKFLFALANDPSKILDLINEVPCEPGDMKPIGIKPLWEEKCKELGRDPVTGRKV